MTRDFKPTRHDLRRLVELYGSVVHLARALGVSPEDLRDWLSGQNEIPQEECDAVLALVAKLKK